MDYKMKLLSMILSAIFLISLAGACSEKWECSSWEKCFDGITQRNCYDLNSCGTSETKPIEIESCSNVFASCYDNKINQDESDIDCGGKICDACPEKKECLKDSDCQNNICSKGICGFEESSPAPISDIPNSRMMLILIITTTVIALILLLAKGKRKETIIKPGKIINNMVILRKNKKERLEKFKGNLKEYLSALNKINVFKSGAKKEKALLNKPAYKQNNHPTKNWMLSNLKEAYG